jgi:hypothetical protein
MTGHKVLSGILLLTSFISYGQCGTFPTTSTISGYYSQDIVPPAGSCILITSDAVITGNLYLTDASVYNCGRINCKNIVMTQSNSDHEFVFENHGTVNVDSLDLRKFGHLHHHGGVLTVGVLKMGKYSYAANMSSLNSNIIQMSGHAYLESMGSIKTNYMNILDTSHFFNYYGSLTVYEDLEILRGSSIQNRNAICIDKKLNNDGNIFSNDPNWKPSIKVKGESKNTGSIQDMDFCDFSSPDGKPDINSGIFQNMTLCSIGPICQDLVLSLDDKKWVKEMPKVYPNPAQNLISIKGLEEQIIESISIVDVLGKSIRQEPGREVDLQNISAGIYFLEIKIKDYFPVWVRFVKE